MVQRDSTGALVHYTRFNPHSPAKWRINVVVLNSLDFAKVFQCKVDTPINPVKKFAGVAMCMIQAVPLTNSNNDNKAFLNNAFCTAPQCVLTAADILNDMDPLADPCQDFSQFVCGGFKDKHEIPPDKSSIGVMDILGSSNNDVTSQDNIKKLQDLYSSCMDDTAILKAGRKPLVDELDKLTSLFPASGSPLEKNTLSYILGQNAKLGLKFPALFRLSVRPDAVDSSSNILFVSETGLFLESVKDYQDVDKVKKYKETVAAMFQSILGDEDVGNRAQPLTIAEIEQEWLDTAKDVVDFEIQLATIATSPSEPYYPLMSNHQHTVEHLNSLTPSIDWSLLLQEALPADVKYVRPITVPFPSYLVRLDALLQKTTSKTVQHYFSWIIIQNLAIYVAGPYKRPLVDYNKSLTGVSSQIKTIRWNTCVNAVNTNLGHMVGHYFIQEIFKGNSRQEVMAIIDNILASYEKDFPTLDWLDMVTRNGAIQKLKSIVKTIGYSTEDPDVTSPQSLGEYYKGYAVSANDYFTNQLQYNIWRISNQFTQLNRPIKRNAMSLAPATVNAYNLQSSNSINFAAGVLQMPYFHVDNPEYVNYGAIGAVAGHEIGHGFDITGRRYDAIGGLKNWWTEATAKAFNEKAQCFVDQYGNFTIRGPDNKDYNLNGRLTLDENLADNGGLKMSFNAWQTRIKYDPNGQRTNNFKLPGLDMYTPEQLFFVSYGRLWCEKIRPEALVNQIRIKNHSPTKWRINGAVLNSPDFARAFQCKLGSPMNPIKKCEVWNPSTLLRTASISPTWLAQLFPLVWRAYNFAIMEKIAPKDVFVHSIRFVLKFVPAG
ncbi:hypothetical protein BGZ95_006521 [Linnemannia exigua]|uniref:Uncharacterized protein n=1 Tax=Linnemannia exigua TaxID=604196 RepID=A0AAD4H8L9_9FUNG|nr:hypothetical protein BGZ95_006521 [Linnemannia exigua]